jgi:uncharacterized protein (DUF427 family)
MANPSPGFRRAPGHRIDLEPGARVAVALGDAPVAATEAAVLLREAGYPARAYVPRADVRARLDPTGKTTHCPFKGDTVYYDVTPEGGETLRDAAWSYDRPYDEMAAIAGLVSFDDRFTVAVS